MRGHSPPFSHVCGFMASVLSRYICSSPLFFLEIFLWVSAEEPVPHCGHRIGSRRCLGSFPSKVLHKRRLFGCPGLSLLLSDSTRNSHLSPFTRFCSAEPVSLLCVDTSLLPSWLRYVSLLQSLRPTRIKRFFCLFVLLVDVLHCGLNTYLQSFLLSSRCSPVR